MANDKKYLLPLPTDSIDFFSEIKKLSNQFWETIEINNGIYGFQIQKGTKWRDGLTEEQLHEFEKEMGFDFPESLKNFYRTMNGVDKKAVNVYGNSGTPFAYWPVFYSYPDDLKIIKEFIDYTFEANQTNAEKIKSIGASRFFPVYLHRCILVDDPAHPILSMYGADCIYWQENLSKLLALEIFENQIENINDFTCEDNTDKVKFWLDWLADEELQIKD